MLAVKPARLVPLVLGLALALTPGTGLGQSDQEKTRVQLQELQREIQRIDREIASASTRRSSLQKQLREADVTLGKLQRSVAGNKKKMTVARAELKDLRTQRAAVETTRGQQQARIITEMRAAWKMGQESHIKVLLNQESPHTVARVMAYYRYFFAARNQLITQYRGTLQELAALQQQIDTTLAQLSKQQETLEQQQASLERAQKNRAKAVASLSKSINSKGARLKQKQADRKELEKLLQAIEEAVVNLQVPANFQDFKSARGNMPWPVQGKPSNRFGTARNEGKMRWQGVTIPAEEGDMVRAIHHGRVVYADWLRGSGLLLIIDHGHGYMSLYAHNESLLRDVGEWVTAGTPIGTAGSSGGQDRSAVYFEIRHNGKPTNPANWCKG
jgi:septal ring factor EnvC (AmiA/AmiB activator)